ncbi:ion transporter [Candidatus Gottesmanbacteria bacterium]|nr:ion transporter [Candidatus Gottesmanbacteria bacterium]
MKHKNTIVNRIKLGLELALLHHGSRMFGPTQFLLSTATIISIASIILETVQEFTAFSEWFMVIEWTAAGIFTLEYLARLWIESKKMGYVFGFWGIADLLSILPTFLGLGNWTFLKSVRTLRMLRLLRMIRLAKISRSYLQSHDQANTQGDMNKINVSIYFLALTSVTIVFGSILYGVEQANGAYANIPLAMLQVARVLVGGVGFAPTSSVFGEVIILLIRFVGLALFGFLVSIIGGILNHWLLGTEKSK